MIGEGPNQNTPRTQTSSSVATVPVVANRPRYSDQLALLQKRTIVDLTAAEQRILAVVMDPANYTKTETERQKLAQVSRTTWYRIVNNPEFTRIERETVRNAVHAGVGAVMQKAFDVAVNVGVGGHQDRKLLLEMGGYYVPRQQTDVTSAGKPVGIIVGVAAEEL